MSIHVYSAAHASVHDETRNAIHVHSSQVTIINFTVTMTGLEDQLLVDVVKNERPDLEAKKDELVRAATINTRTQRERRPVKPHSISYMSLD